MNSITPNTSSELETPAEVEASGMSRRALVRGGALAVGATWAAPAILSAVGAPLASASGGVVDIPEVFLYAVSSGIHQDGSGIAFTDVQLNNTAEDPYVIPPGAYVTIKISYIKPDDVESNFSLAQSNVTWRPGSGTQVMSYLDTNSLAITQPAAFVGFPITTTLWITTNWNLDFLSTAPNMSIYMTATLYDSQGNILTDGLFMNTGDHADGNLIGPDPDYIPPPGG